MTSYIWAVGFDWKEQTPAPSDKSELLATMCISLGRNILSPTTAGVYQIDATTIRNMDFRLFDRTSWKGTPPAATDFNISNFLVRFGRAAGYSPPQPQSPINSNTFLMKNFNYVESKETTPCFANEVSGHAWDAGQSTIVHNGLYELTISFDVTYNGAPKSFKKDPEMEVSGVSG